MDSSTTLGDAIRDLVHANRILAHEGVVDAFGHVSIRHPHNPNRYLMSRSRSPELVSADDVMEFTLAGEAVGGDARRPYGERFIHGAAYERRADVHAVIHNHSYDVVPFSVIGGGKLRPMAHIGAAIGSPTVPCWDIRTKFGDTDMLVTNMEQGRDLAAALGAGRVALMRAHGCVVAGANVREAVLTAIHLQINARLQLQAMQLGEPQYLTPGEIEKCSAIQLSPLALDRAWEYWLARAGCQLH
jgi:HCOMODA/2-hydroxy-3-carboxy-muconic semialdehyde decarboxylase